MMPTADQAGDGSGLYGSGAGQSVMGAAAKVLSGSSNAGAPVGGFGPYATHRAARLLDLFG